MRDARTINAIVVVVATVIVILIGHYISKWY